MNNGYKKLIVICALSFVVFFLATFVFVGFTKSVNGNHDRKLIIEKKEMQIDLGILVPGEKKTGFLNYRNFFNEPISITNIETSCGCLVFSKKNAWIAPNESSEIYFELDVPKSFGELTKRLYIQFDRLDFPRDSVLIKGFIAKSIDSFYKTFDFGYIDGESEITKIFPCVTTDGTELSKENLSFSQNFIKDVSVVKMEDKGVSKNFDLVVTCKTISGKTVGSYKDIITLKNKDFSCEHKIEVTAQMQKILECYPQNVFFEKKNGSNLLKKIKISRNKNIATTCDFKDLKFINHVDAYVDCALEIEGISEVCFLNLTPRNTGIPSSDFAGEIDVYLKDVLIFRVSVAGRLQ